MKARGLSGLLLGLSLMVYFASTATRMVGQAGTPPAIDNDDSAAQPPRPKHGIISRVRHSTLHSGRLNFLSSSYGFDRLPARTPRSGRCVIV